MNKYYNFSKLHGAQLHGSHDMILADGEDTTDLHVDALVRSGDYFSMLATNLDAICEKLPRDSDEAVALERHIRDLLYIAGRYKIVPKH